LQPDTQYALGRAWQALQAAASRLNGRSLAELLDADPGRAQRHALAVDGLYVNYARQLIDDQALQALLALASAVDLPARFADLFGGRPVNGSEQRPALHSLMRSAAEDPPVLVNGVDLSAQAQALRARMAILVDAFEQGRLRGVRGEVLTEVVNVGVGGSDLGAVMVTEALAHCGVGRVRPQFVSGMDGTQLGDALARVDPHRTLFLVSSKSFTTPDTMGNAAVLKAWLTGHAGVEAVSRQVIGVSGNAAAMQAFGIAAEHQLEVPDWVGGRYSVSSPVGLPAALALGWAGFSRFLAGMRRMDRHVLEAPPECNLAIMLGLLAVWQRNLLGCHAHVVLPYSHRLARFPAFLQQLEMESNGKSVRQDGTPVQQLTAPVLFGEFGGNAQHSFMQALHQGTSAVSVDMILCAEPVGGSAEQHAMTLANGLAQAQVLASGRSAAALEQSMAELDSAARTALLPHRVQTGNRSSNILLLRRLDPFHLGMLVALYEHRTYVQACVWGINAFDQWGVEFGKQVAGRLTEALADRAPPPSDADAVTRELLDRLRGTDAAPQRD